MFGFPPIPSWDGLHPLIVHFPIALLLVAPLLVVFGVLGEKHRGLLWAALLLMVLGTVATYVAVPTGEASAELAERSGAISAVVEHHEELAETTRTLFTVLTLVFGVLLAAPIFLRREMPRLVALAVYLPFLAFYLVGSLVLVNTAHQGGRLVHEFGVQAMVASSGSTPAITGSDPGPRVEKEDDDD